MITYTFIERRDLVRCLSFSFFFFNKLITNCLPWTNCRCFRFFLNDQQSKSCFVKAALPWILELLATHFKYGRGSVNEGYVQSLRALILNIYSQKCVPQINEEVEVSACYLTSRCSS